MPTLLLPCKHTIDTADHPERFRQAPTGQWVWISNLFYYCPRCWNEHGEGIWVEAGDLFFAIDECPKRERRMNQITTNGLQLIENLSFEDGNKEAQKLADYHNDVVFILGTKSTPRKWMCRALAYNPVAGHKIDQVFRPITWKYRRQR